MFAQELCDQHYSNNLKLLKHHALKWILQIIMLF